MYRENSGVVKNDDSDLSKLIVPGSGRVIPIDMRNDSRSSFGSDAMFSSFPVHSPRQPSSAVAASVTRSAILSGPKTEQLKKAIESFEHLVLSCEDNMVMIHPLNRASPIRARLYAFLTGILGYQGMLGEILTNRLRNLHDEGTTRSASSLDATEAVEDMYEAIAYQISKDFSPTVLVERYDAKWYTQAAKDANIKNRTEALRNDYSAKYDGDFALVWTLDYFTFLSTKLVAMKVACAECANAFYRYYEKKSGKETGPFAIKPQFYVTLSQFKSKLALEPYFFESQLRTLTNKFFQTVANFRDYIMKQAKPNEVLQLQNVSTFKLPYIYKYDNLQTWSGFMAAENDVSPNGANLFLLMSEFIDAPVDVVDHFTKPFSDGLDFKHFMPYCWTEYQKCLSMVNPLPRFESLELSLVEVREAWISNSKKVTKKGLRTSSAKTGERNSNFLITERQKNGAKGKMYSRLYKEYFGSENQKKCQQPEDS